MKASKTLGFAVRAIHSGQELGPWRSDSTESRRSTLSSLRAASPRWGHLPPSSDFAFLLGSFAAIALLLSGAGIFGMMA